MSKEGETVEEAVKSKKSVISKADALAAIRRNDGSARAAAEEMGVSFKTMCRRVNDLGLERAVVVVHPETKDGFSKLNAKDWDLLESIVVDMAKE